MFGTIIILIGIMAILSVIGSFFEKKKPKVDSILQTSAILIFFIGILLVNVLMFFQLDDIVADTDVCIGQYENRIVYQTKDSEHYSIKWNHFKCWDMFDREYIEVENIESKVKAISDDQNLIY